MVWAEFGIHQRVSLLEERQGTVELAGSLVACETTHGEERIGVIRADLDLLEGKRLFGHR